MKYLTILFILISFSLKAQSPDQIVTDSVMVSLTPYQSERLKDLDKVNKQITDQAKEQLQVIQQQREEIIILIADMNKIDLSKIVMVEPKDSMLTFKLKK